MIFIVPAAILTIAIIIDILIVHLTRKRTLGYVCSFIITLIGVPTLLATLTGSDSDIFQIILALGFALMWWFIYLNIAQAIESSLRIRMLFEIQKNGGQLTLAALENLYNDEQLITIRLRRLEASKAIMVKDNHWHLQSKALRKTAQFFSALKRLFLKRGSQFETPKDQK